MWCVWLCGKFGYSNWNVDNSTAYRLFVKYHDRYCVGQCLKNDIVIPALELIIHSTIEPASCYQFAFVSYHQCKIIGCTMSKCKQIGKDKIIFATKEDHGVPSTVKLPEPEPNPGLILPTGEINWNCPCLGGMATGPCGVPFRDAFSCFHYSEAEPKGSDCFDAFKTMQECMSKYPTLYNKDNDDDDKDDPLEAIANSSNSTNETEQRPIEHREAIESKVS